MISFIFGMSYFIIILSDHIIKEKQWDYLQ